LQTLKPQFAVVDFKKILTIEQNNETVRQQMVSTQKLIRKIEFEKVTCKCTPYLYIHYYSQAIETEEEKDAVVRCLEIIAEGRACMFNFYAVTLTCTSTGGCDLDKTHAGPKLPSEGGTYSITLEFILEMIKWFTDGKTLPKRYVWEIALGAHRAFASEESLVEVPINDGVTVDVIGDVHGKWVLLSTCP
jgi:serine/threonine-protein phosphatase 5